MSTTVSRTPPVRSTLEEGTREAVAERLQPLLVDLLDLSLTGKQFHWTVVGPNFKGVHEHLDELVDAYRGWADEVAERLAAIGVPPDGRVQRVAGDSPADPAPEGWLHQSDVVAQLTDRIEATARRARGALADLGELDPGSEDVVIGILEGLEEQLWMVSAQQA